MSYGQPNSWNWTFDGGTPSTSTDQNPTVTYDDDGIFSVTLEVTNDNDTKTVVKQDYIVAGADSNMPFSEGFEGDFPPTGWHINNPDRGLTFEKSTKSGNYSSSCMIMNNADNSSTGEEDEVVMRALDLSGSVGTTMTFDVAYTKYDDDSPDELRILAATVCDPSSNDWQGGLFEGSS